MATPSGNYQFAFNGWLFGGLGQGVQILEIDGLEDMPSLRVQDDNRGFNDGMWTGRDFLNGRVITFTLQVMNDAAGTMQTYLSELKSNLLYQQSGTGVLQFQLPGRSLQRVSARVRRRSVRIDPEYSYGRSTAFVELFCPDPRIYDDALAGGILTPTNETGRTYNRVYPLVYQTPIATSSAVQSFTNDGNVAVFPTFTISGECLNPIIKNLTTGDALTLNIVMSAADTVVIDTDTRSVTLNGNPARNLVANSAEWFGFEPGATSVAMIAPSSNNAFCNVAFRNGYI